MRLNALQELRYQNGTPKRLKLQNSTILDKKIFELLGCYPAISLEPVPIYLKLIQKINLHTIT